METKPEPTSSNENKPESQPSTAPQVESKPQYRGRGNYYKRGNRGGRGKKGIFRGNNRGMNINYNAFYGRPYQMQQQYYNPYKQQEALYMTEMYIYSKYRNLIDINTKNANVPEEVTSASQFFVIKSFSEEDVHKSIKYKVWSSSKNGNNTLSNAFRFTQENKGHVYLFFSCNGSGRYVGVARMTSPCDENKKFDYWTQDNKWPGLFDVEWIYIKDVPFKEFKNITITMKDGETKPISNARDTQEIPFEQAKIMLSIISKYQNSNTILEHFQFYDVRQDNYEKNLAFQKQQQAQNYNLIKKENKEEKPEEK